jgi:Helix-turn-helix domain
MADEAATAAKKIKAAHPELFQQEKSLARKIAESSLYDWNPTARFLLTQLAVLAMDEDSSYPEDAPDEYHADKNGWCWMSQAKLALRIGRSESQVQRIIADKFRPDGVILYRDWRDSNNTLHAEYKVVEKVVDAYQRPSQNADVKRPSRYGTSRKGTAANQHRVGGKFTKKTAVMDEDDE